jgi:hypothetical protein
MSATDDAAARSAGTLQREVPTPLTFDAPVLGVRVRYETNSPDVIAIAESSLGFWRVLEREPALIEPARALIRIVVADGSEGVRDADVHAPLRYHVPDAERVIAATPGSIAIADRRRAEGLIYATSELVRDRDHFRYGMLEGTSLALLSRYGRTPLHAAALVREGSALLLTARSGVGKSTTAYAAARAGLKVLAEDLVFVQDQPELRVWGWPGALHLPPESVVHFPELEGSGARVLANGKLKLAIRARDLRALPELPVVRRAGICLLTRSGGPTSLERVPAAVLAAELAATEEAGFDLFADQIRGAVQLLCRGGGWRLNVGGTPAQAVDSIRRMLDALDAGASDEDVRHSA